MKRLRCDEVSCEGVAIHAERMVFHESIVVKQFLKWCKRRKLITRNPLEDYRLDKPKLEPKGGQLWSKLI
jgi:hypothetical protein